MSSIDHTADVGTSHIASDEKIAQTTPGLLTLSKPAGNAMRSFKAGGKANERRSKEETVVASQPENEHMLLQSATDAYQDSLSISDQNSALTWQQQQLLSSRPTSDNSSKKKNQRRDKQGTINGDKAGVHKQDVNAGASHKTWQQVLLESGHSHGPSPDVFADVRDLQTFGDVSARTSTNKPLRGKKAALVRDRQRADSMGELSAYSNHHTKRHQAHTSIAVAPSTPDKIAYAGPNFHNSPSPASLPVPKFLQSKGLVASASADQNIAPHQSSPLARHAGVSETQYSERLQAHVSTSSSNSSSEGEHSFSFATNHHPRDQNESTYTTESQGKVINQPMTIENLLSRMKMAGGGGG